MRLIVPICPGSIVPETLPMMPKSVSFATTKESVVPGAIRTNSPSVTFLPDEFFKRTVAITDNYGIKV
jgi:hypothetical protein